jgi:hypothetical protein
MSQAEGPSPLHPELDRMIRESLAGIRFGTVTLVIQDGRVIQIDRSEKVRITPCSFGNGEGI